MRLTYKDASIRISSFKPYCLLLNKLKKENFKWTDGDEIDPFEYVPDCGFPFYIKIDKSRNIIWYDEEC